MELFELRRNNINQRVIDTVVDSLRQGGIIIYPTDTNPALGCDATNGNAVATICRIKGLNPDKKPVTVICASLSQASQYARIDNRAFAIMKANTPGPVTFLLPAASTLPKIFKGRKQVGVRIPDNEIVRALAEELGHPLVSGSIGHSDPWELNDGIAGLLVDVDGTPGESSAIVDLTDSTSPTLLREGPVEVVL